LVYESINYSYIPPINNIYPGDVRRYQKKKLVEIPRSPPFFGEISTKAMLLGALASAFWPQPSQQSGVLGDSGATMFSSKNPPKRTDAVAFNGTVAFYIYHIYIYKLI